MNQVPSAAEINPSAESKKDTYVTMRVRIKCTYSAALKRQAKEYLNDHSILSLFYTSIEEYQEPRYTIGRRTYKFKKQETLEGKHHFLN